MSATTGVPVGSKEDAQGSAAAAGDSALADEVEPQLKYERLGADVKTILQASSATCLCLSEKVLALGTSKGKIHVLDYSGNEVNCFAPHSAPVQHLSFDDKAEYIASTCHDSSVAVSNLFTGDVSKYTFKRPVQVVALDPRYSSRKNKEFATGDVRGKVKISSQGWLGRGDHLVADEGRPVTALQWSGGVLVWATHLHVKVYDTNAHQLIGSLSRPKGGAHVACRRCSLYLHEGTTLYIAWADAVRVVKIEARQDGTNNSGGGAAASPAVAGAATGGVGGMVGAAGVRYQLVTLTDFTTTYLCLGVVPHGSDLAVLAYMTDVILQQEEQEEEEGLGRAGLGEEGVTSAPPSAGGSPAQLQHLEVSPSSSPAAGGSLVLAAPPGGAPVAGQQAGADGADPPAAATAAGSSSPAGSPDMGHLLQQGTSSPRPSPTSRAAANSSYGMQLDADPSASTPIHVPQRTRGSKRAATALVRSPSGAGMLQASVSSPTQQPGAGLAAQAAGEGAGASPAGTSEGGALGDSSMSSSRRPSDSDPPDASSSRGTPSRAVSVGGASAISAPPTPSTPSRPPLHPGSRLGSWKLQQQPPDADVADYQPSGTPLRPELRIVSMSHQEVASDALSVRGYAAWLPNSYTLVPSYSNIEALMAFDSALGGSSSSAALGAGGVDQVAGAGEFMYFIVSPQDIVIGRFRDAEDRITWSLAHGRYQAALALAERERGLPAAVWDATVQAYLEHLTSTGQWQLAAGQLGRLLRGSADKWEAWVGAFAAADQVALLAALVPIESPQLSASSYEAILNGLLKDPANHGRVLLLVQSWPRGLYSAPQLIGNIAQEMRLPGGETRELWQALALLYKGEGRPDLSLAIYLQLQLPLVFEFIQDNPALLTQLDHKAALLLAIDEGRGLQLLVGQYEVLPPGVVVPGLLDAMEAAEGEAAQEAWRRRLYLYLHRVFLLDPAAAAEFAELQVHLYAEYAPQQLLEFLSASQYYPLEAALEVVTQKGMVPEQVYLLSRMGNARGALALIIQRQADIPAAIEFVEAQRDDELWEELITWALQQPATTGQLLEHIGGHLNPLRVIEKLPHGMVIDKLRDRLRAIIADFRTQTCLREGCNAILRSDCYSLMRRLQQEVARAIPLVYISPADQAGQSTQGVDQAQQQWRRYACRSLAGSVAVAVEDVPVAVTSAAAAAAAEAEETHLSAASLEHGGAAAGGQLPASYQSAARLVCLSAAGAGAAAGSAADLTDADADSDVLRSDRSAMARFAASSGKSMVGLSAATSNKGAGAAARAAGMGRAAGGASRAHARQRAAAHESSELPSLIRL